MAFIGRDHEVRRLQEAIASKRAELGFVYGRRRVGKSTLLQHLVKRKGDLYFEGLRGISEKEQIEHFLIQLSEQSGAPRAQASDWREALDALTFYIKSGVHYVVFDEFPWMASGRTALVSLLKYYWDNHWKKNGRLTLVLCGSIAAFMARHVVHSEALHNRKTFEIHLRPLPALEAKRFFNDFRSSHEIARFLMIFGGVPKYLEQIDPKRSLAQNLDALCFHKHGFFYNEFETIFKEQFKVTKTYERIVKQLAKKRASREQLAKTLRMSAGGGFSGYLENLEQAEFVKIMHPLGIGKSDSAEKTSRVYLWDEWLRFYFAFVAPHRKRIAHQTEPGLFEALTARSFETWCGLSFELLCLKNMPTLLQGLGISEASVLDYGPFFRQGSRKAPAKGRTAEEGLQIDILLKRRGDVLTVIECKFRNQPIGPNVVSQMKKKIALLKAPRGFTIERILISAGDVSDAVIHSGYFHQIAGLETVLG